MKKELLRFKKENQLTLMTLSCAIVLMVVFIISPSLGITAEESVPVAEETSDENLDVTITGESQDDVPLKKEEPPLTISFKDVVGLSREGQTERVLASPVEHLKGDQVTSLVKVGSQQTILPLPVKIPSAPFFQVEVIPGVSAFIWQLDVVDQDNKVVNTLEGTSLPKHIVQWDGYSGNVFKVKVGPAYTPILTITDENGKKQRYFGESVQLDALQYEQDGLLHIEFGNDRLFNKKSSSISKDIKPLLHVALNIMRQHMDGSYRVTMYESPKTKVTTQERIQTLKNFIVDHLRVESNLINVNVLPLNKKRGRVTDIVMRLR